MASLCLAPAALADPPPERHRWDLIEVAPHEDAWELTWSDTEERLRGRLSPVPPRVGQPLHVSLDVGSYEGIPFTGPLVLTLREAGAIQGESVTVTRGEHHWETTFTPTSTGTHLLDVGFRTTRSKALHASFEVGRSSVPRLVGWGALGIGLLFLLGYSIRALLRQERAVPPKSPSPPPDAPPSPPAVAEESPPAQIQAPTEPPDPSKP